MMQPLLFVSWSDSISLILIALRSPRSLGSFGLECLSVPSMLWTAFLIVNRTKSVIKREQNNSLLLLCRVWTDYLMFMCRQTGNLWFILIEKGRVKKGWGNTLRQKGDFLGCFYSKSWSSPLFSSKKFGYFKLKQYLCTTRTRQASQRCSNVRVVLFLYNE